MDLFVADTHALLWYLVGSARLGPMASQAFTAADAGKARILLPTIVLAELFYANEKHGPYFDFLDVLRRLESADAFNITPLTTRDIHAFASETAVTEMHDRIIAGVARRHDAVLLTRDRNLTSSGVRVVW